MVEDDSYDSYTFEERMEMLIEAEATARRDRKVAKLVRRPASSCPSACVEDVVYLKDRKLSRDRVARLASCDWVEACETVVIISKTGCGKSFSAKPGNAACRRLFTVRYARLAGHHGGPEQARGGRTGATTSTWTPTRPSSCSSSTTS